MAEPYTSADALGLYATTSGGASVSLTPENSLGGMRSPREVRGLDCLIEGAMASVIIEQVSGEQGEGTAIISGSDEDYLQFTPTSGNIGTAVEVLDGELKQITSTTSNRFVRVRRDGTADLGDYITLDCRKSFNNLLGFSNVSVTDSAAGISHYRAAMIHAHGPDDVSAIKVYLTPLGTTRTSETAQLGATGSGTITTLAGGGFSDWPSAGWCKIFTSGSVLREVVYYTSRTSSSLTVPAAGRARLGTSASAGAADDSIIPIPGIRIGLETPDADGMIQTIANETTEPTGITWGVPHNTATALSIATIESGKNHGLWIHREIPAGATGTYKQENGITIEHGGFTLKYYGLYKIAQLSLAKRELFQGIDAFPSFASAVTSAAAFPLTYALSAPVSGIRRHRLVVRTTDAYGLTGFNTYPHDILLNSSGVQVGATITEPYDITLENTAGGYARLRAKYRTGIDSTNADTFRYYVTTNGTNPTTGGTPIDVTMAIGQGLSSSRILDVTLGPYGYGTDLRVLVTSYRTSDTAQSVNTTPATVAINTVAPSAPALLSVGYEGAYDANANWSVEEKLTYFNSPTNTVFLKASTGMTEFWSGSTLIFRGLYGGDGYFVMYIPTDFTLINASVSGTGTASAFEVVSANEIYLCVDGTRRVKLDLSAMEITAATINAPGTAVPNNNPTPETNFVGSGYTTVQIYDPAAGTWASMLSVDSAGTMNARVIRQITT